MGYVNEQVAAGIGDVHQLGWVPAAFQRPVLQQRAPRDAVSSTEGETRPPGLKGRAETADGLSGAAQAVAHPQAMP